MPWLHGLASPSHSDGSHGTHPPTIACAEANAVASARFMADWRWTWRARGLLTQSLAFAGTATGALAQCWMTSERTCLDVIPVDNAATPALERFQILRPCLENGMPLAQLSRERKLQLRTLQRWVRAYRQRGLLGLVRMSRADRGARRRISADLEQLTSPTWRHCCGCGGPRATGWPNWPGRVGPSHPQRAIRHQRQGGPQCRA
jgi:transposase-like protein